MCLAIPGKIKSIESQFDGLVRMAKVSFGGIIKEASLEMVPQAKEEGEVADELNINDFLPDKEEYSD